MSGDQYMTIYKAMRLQALDRIKPAEAEVSANPRARSAIMRTARRTEVPA